MMGIWQSSSTGRKIGIVALVIAAVIAMAVWIALIVLRPAYPKPAELTAAAKAQAALTGGAKAYTTHCAYCHDKGFGPSFAGKGYDSAAIASFVRAGPNNMPAFPPSQLSDADIALIATYAAKLPKPEAKP